MEKEIKNEEVVNEVQEELEEVEGIKETVENYFAILNSINVQDKIEKKNGLSYLSWAWAWGEVKKLHPNANYKIYERETQYGPVNYFTDGKTCWVKTGVIINDIEHIEELPVMDYKNKSIFLDNVTSFDVNKTIQRSLTKACARHGLGLYIYAGEDLPEEEQKEKDKIDELKSKIKVFGSKASDKLKEIGKKLSELNEEELKDLLSNLEKEVD